MNREDFRDERAGLDEGHEFRTRLYTPQMIATSAGALAGSSPFAAKMSATLTVQAMSSPKTNFSLEGKSALLTGAARG